jgi:signal transduction histidine kinase
VQADETQVVLRVKDTGIGIPPEMLPRIFDMFAQVHRNSEFSQGGLGIGLSLVRSLVLLHGGSVEVVSAPNQGSEFTVRLPRGSETSGSQPDSTALPPSESLA